MRKWGLVGILIGLGAAAGALFFLALSEAVGAVALGWAAGYEVPLPAGEGGPRTPVEPIARLWMVPVVAAAGGLVGGLLVWRFAPEARGIGTDAAIDAFHKNTGVSLRAVIVKALSAAVSLGTGLTTGREGPVAQIGAGAGSTISASLGLTQRERNIALAAGLGAGIAAIFRAPLAGAVLAAEVFYREDLEVEALFPALIASVTGYAVVGYAVGFTPIFSTGLGSLAFSSPLALALYAVLGVGCAMAARLMIATMRRSQSFFRRYRLYVATTVGALATGLIAMVFPTVTGTGYGWVQFALLNDFSSFPLFGFVGSQALLIPLILLAAALAEILASALTLGSGNSGGIFGPSIVTGGLLGAAFGFTVNYFLPGLAENPSHFAVVGMVAFFAGAAKAPISTIVMIAEMTGGYVLLGPSMVAVFTSFVLSGKGSVFPAQVRSRLDSLSHADEFAPIILRKTKVQDVLRTPEFAVDPHWPVDQVLQAISKKRTRSVPVLEGGKLAGMVSRQDLLGVRPDERAGRTVADVMSAKLVTAKPQDDLYAVLERLLTNDVAILPVVDPKAPERLVGVVGRREIAAAIAKERQRVAAGLRPAAPPQADTLKKLSFFTRARRPPGGG
ncbi:MAG TPA: chloride channel protein [Candidatus Thermoplasmatota archaeon]